MGIPSGARDMKLDPITGDLVLENGDLVFVSGVDSIAQDIKLALGLCLGEWFLDETVGVPYFQKILGQKIPDLLVVREIFRQQLLAVPGVLDVVDITVTLGGARTLLVNWKVSTDLGELTGVQTTP